MNTDTIKQQIIDTIKATGKKRVRRRELFNLCKIKGVSYEKFKAILTEMEEAGTLVRMKGRRFAIPDAGGVLIGTFQASPYGGYVRFENGEGLYVQDRDTNGALSGDTVQVARLKRRGGGGRNLGLVLAVLERRTDPVVGVLRRQGATSFLITKEPDIPFNLLVKPGCEGDAEDGQLVVARIDREVTGRAQPQCIVTGVLGSPDAPGMDVLSIIIRYRLPYSFPDDVIAESENVSADIGDSVTDGRRDLRDAVTFTIDPVDARDFDDAISIARTDSGYELGVHIADVAHYVRSGGIMDIEAKERSMSCYLVDRVIPMLPERLSNDLCSLRPGEDRLTKSVFAAIDREGRLVSYEIVNTVIHSKARLTYEQVQAFLDGTGDDADGIPAEVGESLRILAGLTDTLIGLRRERGGLDMDLPEARVVLNDQGEPENIVEYPRYHAHRMVEEAMLMANTVTAQALTKVDAPLLYRIHDEPDFDRLEKFGEVAKALGYDFRTSQADDQRYLQRFLYAVKDSPHSHMLNTLLLRSMKKAAYSPHNIGHYGLALDTYAHFTSPIRRYPDLVVHRQLDAFVTGAGNGEKHRDMDYFEQIGAYITDREIVTAQAERDSIKMKTAEFMQRHLGEEFEGRISGMMPFGFFVELSTVFVEGLVHVSSLDDDYYDLDELGIAMIGRNGNRRFMIGDWVKVVVARADKDHGEVDFFLLDHRRGKANSDTETVVRNKSSRSGQQSRSRSIQKGTSRNKRGYGRKRKKSGTGK